MNIDEIRRAMPITRHYNFMNHAAVAPVCGRGADAMRRYLDEASEHAYARGGLYPESKRVRQVSAKLLNCHPEEVTFVKNTSEGLSYVANGLQWSRGDNVVTAGVEFPANIYPWMHLKPQGVQLKMVPEDNGRVPIERIAELIDDRTRVVTISAVQFGSGFRTDLAALGTICQQRGVLFCVDGIQAVGCVPIDVRAMKIDFLSADGHKWLLSPEGIGLFYCRHELLGLLRPSSVGWLGVKNPMDFGTYKLDFRDDARRFDGGSYNLAGIWALGATIDWMLEIGVDKIWERISMLTERLVKGVKAKGYRIVSPREAHETSGIVTFVSSQHDHEKIVNHLLKEYKTVIAARLGRLRVSPHFYNTEDEVDQLIDHLPAN